MNSASEMWVIGILAMQVGVLTPALAQTGGSRSRVVVGYVRDTTSVQHSTNGGVVLPYRDRQGRVITVSIRRMLGPGGRWSPAEEADSVDRVQDQMARKASSETVGPCEIGYAERDSIPVLGGRIWGRARAEACLVGDSTVYRLLYTYPVRANVIVFQSEMSQTQWNTSRFELFIHEFVQRAYADSTA